MDEFFPGCRVRCVDATPLPINVDGAVFTDFSFPAGLLNEGTIYLVERVGRNRHGGAALSLVGFPVLYLGNEIPWDGLRFERLPERTESQAEEAARDSGKRPLAAFS